MPYIYSILLGVFVLASCGAPLQVVRVAPSEDAAIDRYFYGNPVQRIDRDEVTVEVNYYDASRDFLVFDVQVTNSGETDIQFDPTYSALVGDNGLHRMAVDPELQLLSLDYREVQQLQSRRAMNWIGTGLLVAGTVYAATTPGGAAGSDNLAVSSLITDFGFTLVDAMTFSIINNEVSSRQQSAPEVPDPENRLFWLDHSLRLTTLRPGESAVGKLVFERLDEARRLTLRVDVGSQRFTFPYTQRTIRPGRDRVARPVGTR